MRPIFAILLALINLTFLIEISHASTKTISGKIDELVSEHYPSDQPGASVLVAIGDEIILHKAYGMADMEHRIPLTTSMHFRIASLTKQITAMAALKLEQQGKVSFSDPIQRYLPDYDTKGHRVTVGHLVSNTSGIQDMQPLPGFTKLERIGTTLDNSLAFIEELPFEFEPGSDYSYSSSNFLLLGKIIEEASGQSYMDYLSTTFFEPLTMQKTYFGSFTEILPQRVQGYELRGKELINAPFIDMSAPHAAGSLRSTTGNFYRWQKALINGELFSNKELQRAWSRTKLTDGTQSNYGYGWFIGELDGMKTVSHAGGINGFSTFATIVPQHDLHIIIFSNLPRVRMHQLTAKMIRIAQQQSLEPSNVKIPADLRQQLKGEYFMQDFNANMNIIEDNERLLMELPWSTKPTPLYFDGKSGVYFAGSWTRFIPLSNNSRGDILMEYWHGERSYGSLL